MAEGGNELENRRPDGDVLEGGAVEPLQDYPIAELHRANTARYLALALVVILGPLRRVSIHVYNDPRLHGKDRCHSEPRQDIQHFDASAVRLSRGSDNVLLYEGKAMITTVKPHNHRTNRSEIGIETKHHRLHRRRARQERHQHCDVLAGPQKRRRGSSGCDSDRSAGPGPSDCGASQESRGEAGAASEIRKLD
jgi:hypothetical protein